MAYNKADWVCGGGDMKKAVLVIMTVITFTLIFLTPIPFDEAAMGLMTALYAILAK